MDTRNLRASWKAPENGQLTKQQLSFRLPIDVAAKLFALEQLYPGRTRTQIVSDLLSLALNDFEEQLPFHAAQYRSKENGDPEDLWIMEGERRIFREYANTNHRGLYREVKGNREGPLFPQDYWREDEIPEHEHPQ